jgi:hypothetical protein
VGKTVICKAIDKWQQGLSGLKILQIKKQADLAQRYYRQTDRHDQELKVFFAYPKS